MTGELQFEQRSDGYWVAEDGLWVAGLAGGASYRIAMHPGKLRPDYDLTFVERRPSLRGGLLPRYERVSTHRSIERAIERAHRHHRDRAKLTVRRGA